MLSFRDNSLCRIQLCIVYDGMSSFPLDDFAQTKNGIMTWAEHLAPVDEEHIREFLDNMPKSYGLPIPSFDFYIKHAYYEETPETLITITHRSLANPRNITGTLHASLTIRRSVPYLEINGSGMRRRVWNIITKLTILVTQNSTQPISRSTLRCKTSSIETQSGVIVGSRSIDFLAATIQPQRRGRPTRGPVAPPPATQTSASSLTASPQAYGSRMLPQSRSSPTPSNASRPQSISPQPQLVSDIKQFAADFSDAFEPEGSKSASQTGVPRPQGENSDSFGFENSFAPSPTLNASTQKLSPLTTSKSLQPGVGNGVSSSSGFETSFSPASPADDAALSSSKTANVPATKVEYSPGAERASSNPGAEISFEDRYPSLERLHSNNSANSPSGSSPLLSPLNSASGNGANAYAKPQRGGNLQRSMPSYHQASLTGGALGEGHAPFNDINGGVPRGRGGDLQRQMLAYALASCPMCDQSVARER
ncbi:hypothetical protein QFC20_007644 [Naganishia adeliensis]|uniref:Uncharacterized protein n=1 Tax=Naganishia adeliensis TaxID=92952 RepID=A0ACC2UXQ7_9TREE|nr:hypothetical protein QFC20_007644 [Naganishia adeliensis]